MKLKILKLNIVILLFFFGQINNIYSQNSFCNSFDNFIKIVDENNFDTVYTILNIWKLEKLLNVDTTKTLKLGYLEFKENQEPNFSIDLGKYIKDEKLNNLLFSYYNSIPDFRINSNGKPEHIWLDFDLLLSLQNQHSEVVIDTLKTDYYYWENCAKKVKSNYPKGFKRFWLEFFGPAYHTSEYETCKLNALKIAIILNSLNIRNFEDSVIIRLRKEQPGIYKDDRFFKIKNNEALIENIDIIQTERNYLTIEDVFYDTELIQNHIFKRQIDNAFCFKYCIYENNIGILSIGCQYAPLSGYGEIFQIKLNSQNEIEIKKLGSWIS